MTAEIKAYLDADTAQAVKSYIENLKKSLSEVDAKAKVLEQWHALIMYFTARQLSAGGNKVHLIYWNVKPLIKNLGSGTVDVVSFSEISRLPECTAMCLILP